MAQQGDCWFCGGAHDDGQGFRVALHRNVEATHYGIAWREKWDRTELTVPRCRRCRVGHGVETLLLIAGIPAIAWAAGLLIDGLTGAAGTAPLDRGSIASIVALSLPFAAWVALVLGAFGLRRRRHVRRHPQVAQLLEDGWRYGGAPILNFDKRWPGLG